MLITKTALVSAIRAFFWSGIALALLACEDQSVDLNSPQAIYDSYCFACHDTGAAGAPKLTNHEFWQAAAADKARLYKNTLSGVQAMPRRGTCLSCTDEQLQQTVDWMLQAAGQNNAR